MGVLYRVGLEAPRPDVVPMADGGIQIEWYYSATEVEIEVPPTGPMTILLAFPDGDYTENMVLNATDWEPARKALQELKAS